MNRIYQGPATSVEQFGERGDAVPPDEWIDKIWDDHGLFQDAVNYYAFALRALAAESSRLFRIRSLMAAKKKRRLRS